MNLKTIILRFRDLVTSENGTIKQHKEIIDNHGYVWWAWWKKGGEKIPNDFSMLSTQVKENPVCVFLVDSGQNILYRAICNNIEVRTSTKIPSPEKDKTPTYYCNQSYYVWFKFTEIEQKNLTLITKLFYLIQIIFNLQISVENTIKLLVIPYCGYQICICQIMCLSIWLEKQGQHLPSIYVVVLAIKNLQGY